MWLATHKWAATHRATASAPCSWQKLASVSSQSKNGLDNSFMYMHLMSHDRKRNSCRGQSSRSGSRGHQEKWLCVVASWSKGLVKKSLSIVCLWMSKDMLWDWTEHDCVGSSFPDIEVRAHPQSPTITLSGRNLSLPSYASEDPFGSDAVEINFVSASSRCKKLW